MSTPFRHSAAFGKRIEYWVIGLMLKEGLDVYVPLVDDDAIDIVVKKPDGSFIEVQVKARSHNTLFGDGALFSAITHEHRKNYWFVFYSERLDTIFIMSSAEFIAECVQNKNGKNIGKRGIWFNGKRKNKETGEREEYVKERFQKYIAKDFRRIIEENVS